MAAMKVLIGYDGSNASEGIVDDLRRAGIPRDTECLVVTYTESWVPEEDEQIIETASDAEALSIRVTSHGMLDLQEARRLSSEYAAIVAGAFQQWTVTDEAHSNAPQHGLIERCFEWRPDLLVVGSHGRRALARGILGSVSQGVLANAPCAVRISREPKGLVGGVRIVVGTDGSRLAGKAVETVAGRAWPDGSSVKVITVDHEVTSSPILDRRVDEAAAIVRAAGLEAEALVLAGTPADVLLEEASRWGADAIFVGAIGHSLIDRIAIGSVSASLVARARCSVEIAR